MLHLRMIYDEILKNSVFASSRPGRTDARVILILALLLKYKRLRRKMILFSILIRAFRKLEVWGSGRSKRALNGAG